MINNLIDRKVLHTLVLIIFGVLIFLNFPLLCNSHDHHDHHDESPAFKYSQTANEAFKPHEHHHPDPAPPRDTTTLWVEALLSTLLISCAPFFILFFVPLDKSKEKEPLLKLFLSFASGGLLGDAFLHLIPHALAPHSHDEHDHHSHDEHGHEHGHDMTVGLWVLSGIMTFLLVEKGVRLMKGEHGHSHGSLPVPETKSEETVRTRSRSEKAKKKNENHVEPENNTNTIAVSGYLNLAADFTHNFTDGLAIGASYLAGKNVGIVTTLTILFHEVPHEIGDFAILIQSGCSRKKAMLLQLTTAIGAFSGTVISLMAGGMGDMATSGILPFTAGGFIYIATVSVIPELLSDSNLKQSIKEILAMGVGVYMMVYIASFE